MIREFDPAGVVDLSELDQLASIEGSDVQPQTTATCSISNLTVIIEVTIAASCY